jgi:hypothetical protein
MIFYVPTLTLLLKGCIITLQILLQKIQVFCGYVVTSAFELQTLRTNLVPPLWCSRGSRKTLTIYQDTRGNTPKNLNLHKLRCHDLNICHGCRDHIGNYYNFTNVALTKNKYMLLEQTEGTNTELLQAYL